MVLPKMLISPEVSCYPITRKYWITPAIPVDIPSSGAEEFLYRLSEELGMFIVPHAGGPRD